MSLKVHRAEVYLLAPLLRLMLLRGQTWSNLFKSFAKWKNWVWVWCAWHACESSKRAGYTCCVCARQSKHTSTSCALCHLLSRGHQASTSCDTPVCDRHDPNCATRMLADCPLLCWQTSGGMLTKLCDHTDSLKWPASKTQDNHKRQMTKQHFCIMPFLINHLFHLSLSLSLSLPQPWEISRKILERYVHFLN